jgi:hypothetical protein
MGQQGRSASNFDQSSTRSAPFGKKAPRCHAAHCDGNFGSIVTITILRMSAVVADLSAKIA